MEGGYLTLQELSAYMRIMEKIQVATETLDRLRAKAEPGACNYTGMPKGSGLNTPTEYIGIEIAEIMTDIEKLQIQADGEREKLEAFIACIPDFKVRIVAKLRFLHCMTWIEVADHMGKYYTDSAVRQVMYRYLRNISTSENKATSHKNTPERRLTK